jgi:hypothetical protein
MGELYADLLRIEKSCADWREGMDKAGRAVMRILEEAGTTYEEFIFSFED